MNENQHTILTKLYNDPLISLHNPDKLLIRVRELYPKHYWTRAMIAEFVEEQAASQILKKKQKIYLPTYADKIGELMQIDLLDCSKYSKWNKGTHYILVCIDVYSRYLWTFPLKAKTAEETKAALQQLLIEIKPNKISSDNGKEFTAKTVQNLFEKDEIIHILAQPGDHAKMGVVERVNRTLRDKISYYMITKDTYTFVDVLPQLTQNYNNTFHSSINAKPIDVFDGKVWPSMKEYQKKNRASNVEAFNKQAEKLKPGTNVRIAEERTVFTKGSAPRFSDKIYQIEHRSYNKFKVVGKSKLYSINELLIAKGKHNPSVLAEQKAESEAQAKQQRFLKREGLL